MLEPWIFFFSIDNDDTGNFFQVCDFTFRFYHEYTSIHMYVPSMLMEEKRVEERLITLKAYSNYLQFHPADIVQSSAADFLLLLHSILRRCPSSISPQIKLGMYKATGKS